MRTFRSKYLIKTVVCYLAIVCVFTCCKDVVDIPNPSNSLTTDETFSSFPSATSAVTAIYNSMSFGANATRYASGLTTIATGLSADELIDFNNPENAFMTNNLLRDNGDISGGFWVPAYSDIYKENAAIEGLESSKTLAQNFKRQLIGESKFLRAFSYFYLVNLFGDVPLVTSTSFEGNSLMHRTSSAKVYEQIILDLKDAQNLLGSDYSVSGEERIRANKWAATALLSRVYLYVEDWTNAEKQASMLLSNSALFSLEPDLDAVFRKNSKEAILQWQCINQSNFKFATQEGNLFNPPDLNTTPNYLLTEGLVAAFDQDDRRQENWVGRSIVGGVTYHYPRKYKMYESAPGEIDEYNTPLRLAEQYLIRAEARARQNRLSDAVEDLNVIRERAGLSPLSTSLTSSEVVDAVVRENRLEFFTEWGHRWFDLKRTKSTDRLLSEVKKPNWQTTDQLYPVPYSEIIADPNLTQNAGY